MCFKKESCTWSIIKSFTHFSHRLHVFDDDEHKSIAKYTAQLSSSCSHASHITMGAVSKHNASHITMGTANHNAGHITIGSANHHNVGHITMGTTTHSKSVDHSSSYGHIRNSSDIVAAAVAMGTGAIPKRSNSAPVTPKSPRAARGAPQSPQLRTPPPPTRVVVPGSPSPIAPPRHARYRQVKTPKPPTRNVSLQESRWLTVYL